MSRPLDPAPKLTQRDVQTVIRHACLACQCSTDDFYGRNRHPTAIAARQIVTVVLRDNSNLSFPEIAHLTGRPNHSTTITQYYRTNRQLSLPAGDAWRLVQVSRNGVADIGDLLGVVLSALGLVAAEAKGAAGEAA